MGEGVAVVQEGTAPALTLVLGHDPRLDLDAPRHPLGEREATEVLAGEEVVLGHLAEATGVLAWRKGVEHVGVAQHRGRLPERADQVLALREVHARLAADGGVDLAEQRGGHVHHRHTPVVHRRGEPRRVGHHPATHGDDHVLSCQPPLGELPAEVLHRVEALGPLALVDEERAMLDAGVDGHPDRCLGDDRGPVGPRRHHPVEPVPCARADQHVVAVGAQLDRDGGHTVPAHRQAASTHSATCSPVRSSTTTTASANRS